MNQIVSSQQFQELVVITDGHISEQIGYYILLVYQDVINNN